MNSVSVQGVQCQPQQTPEQVKASIDNLKWQEKQQESNVIYAHKSQDQQVAIAHQQYMVEHVYAPLATDATIVILAIALFLVVLKFIAASVTRNRDDNAANLEVAKESNNTDIAKNRDDNEAQVRYASYLQEKMEKRMENQGEPS